MHDWWGWFDVVGSWGGPVDQQATGRGQVSAGDGECGQLILAAEEVLEGGESEEDEVELLGEVEAAHVASDDVDSGLVHPSLADGEHVFRGIDGRDLESVERHGHGDPAAASAQFEDSLGGSGEFPEHLDVVGEGAEIEVVPGRDRTQGSYLVIVRPVEGIVHAVSAQPLHRSESAYQ